MGDSKRRLLAGRRSVLLGTAGLASAALAACATTESVGQSTTSPASTALPSSAPAIPSAGPAAPPPPIEALSSQQAAAAQQSRAGNQAGAPPSNVSSGLAALPDKEQIIAEFGGLRPKEWGLHVTGVVNGSASRHAALTFDACGGPGGTGCGQQLLATLRSLNVPATLFMNQRWIQANPGLAAELAADPLFELANHGSQHRPLSVAGQAAYGIPGTAGVGAVYDEIMGNQPVLGQLTGKAARFFRPGTAFYDEVTAAITRRLGLLPVNFTINGDAGASYPAGAVAAEVGRTGAGDIVISHFNKPGSGTAAGYAKALPRLLDHGVTFAHLGDVLPL
ncbi:polysaccharide deacetylase family protein [Arthrobacter sp. CJ23]|uniref:polysaccharide deacetylase family protein n=1 Tax=Arthrobacter sp. CJ23 TaxID=2972479 RepID=UPI00215D595E|nr:polysaccharide deacetylase family protein [Arthrobacter sp. CJ23]UVJ41469.1 polysaccharide deacetylase family protein [Arthrobacter sp. CJ23]